VAMVLMRPPSSADSRCQPFSSLLTAIAKPMPRFSCIPPWRRAMMLRKSRDIVPGRKGPNNRACRCHPP
jgi:hypothetical protein